MSEEPVTESRPRQQQKAPANLTTALLILVGLGGLIAIVAGGLIFFAPNLANVASEGISSATSSYRVGAAAAYPGAKTITITDAFRKNFDQTAKGDLMRNWVNSVGIEQNLALSYLDRVRVEYGLFSTSDDIGKVEQFYKNQLQELGFRMYSSQSESTGDKRSFVNTPRREVIIVTLAKPVPQVLSNYTKFGMDAPKDRNILYVTSAAF